MIRSISKNLKRNICGTRCFKKNCQWEPVTLPKKDSLLIFSTILQDFRNCDFLGHMERLENQVFAVEIIHLLYARKILPKTNIPYPPPPPPLRPLLVFRKILRTY